MEKLREHGERAKKTYDSALAQIDPQNHDSSGLYNKTVAQKKKFTVTQINNYYKTYGYNYGVTGTEKDEIEEAWAKTLGIDKSELKSQADDLISGRADKIQGATADQVNDLDEETQKKLEKLLDNRDYKHPDVAEKTDSSNNKDDMDMDNTIKNADAFVNKKGEDGNPENNINTEDLKDFFNPLYNITLVIGIIVAVLVGAVLGVKFLTGSVEQKADTKKLLIPYLAGCVAVFGAFGIWKLVVTILADM